MKVKTKKRLAGLLAVIVVLSLLPATVFAVGTSSAEDEAALREAVSNGDTITVNTEITLTQPLSVDRDVTLTGNGTLKLSEEWSENSASPITVEEGAALTIDGITLDGNQVDLSYGANSGSALYIAGSLVLNSGSIQNFSNPSTQSYAGVIYINAGTFTMNGGYIQKNSLSTNRYHGIVYVTGGSTFTLNDGILSGNRTADAQGASGIVYVSNEGGSNTFEMNGGSISDNESCAVFVGGLNSTPTGKALFIMENGNISGNTYGQSYYAGGIYAVGGEVVMNGGTIEQNEGQFYGGGVALVANSEKTATRFEMNGGVISDNSAMYGGGIYVTGIQNTDWAVDVQLNGGQIQNNEASRQGGGIYVVKGQTVQLRNAAIYENTASIIGGGIWTCSTGNVKTYITNGGAVFDNTASGNENGSAGDDLALVQHEDETSADFKLADRALGGGQVTYYKDGGVYAENYAGDGLDGSGEYYLGISDGSSRYDAENPGEAIEDVELLEGSYALKSVISDNAKTLAKSKADLVITGNTTNRGAGIGSNGSVIIGDAPEDGGTEYALNVTKVWSEEIAEDAKQEIEVVLVADGYELDSVILNEENGWQASFTGLPVGIYSVKEQNVPAGMEASYSELSINEKTQTFHITVTNSLVPDEPGTGTDTDTESPDTGDSNSLGLWITLAFVGVAALAGVVFLILKRKAK